jgi:tRNA-dihydrouridine synthase A
VDHVLRFRDVAIDDGCEGGVFFALEAARAFELGFAFDDPGVGGGFAVKGLRLAVDDGAVLLDDDLGGESLRTVFARPSNYRTHFAAAPSVVSVGSIKNSVRHEPEEYDFVVPQMRKWVKMSQNGTTSALTEINEATDRHEKSQQSRSYRFCVAPMMEWTDRHCRFFHRLLTRRALLYTEMLTTGAVLHGDRARLLRYDPAEHPLALQLGGCDPQALAACARIGADLGFDEINLNVGCPSDRVQEGRFGACLMAEPALVAECVTQMKAAVSIRVTVKCRLGIDDQDPDEALGTFASAVEAVGADALIVHARKAWLEGLSPKENREVPPLDYTRVFRLKSTHPRLVVILNGGIGSVEAAHAHLAHVDGVMMGRAGYQEPWRLMAVDPLLFGEDARFTSAKEAAAALIPYIERELAQGTRLHAITRHLHGLFRAVPGARAYRRHLAGAAAAQAGIELLLTALTLVRDGAGEFADQAA